MKFSILAIAAATAIAATSAGAVTVTGATKIQITNAVPTWLQVAEVQAFNFSATNVALSSNGGLATGSSTYDGTTPAARANDGNTGGSYGSGEIFHSGSPSGSEFLNITFGAANLSSLSIFGRTDCCNDRDVYNVTVFNAAGATLYSGQLSAVGQTATVSFDAAAAAPEPASWALMVMGFGLVGFAARRRSATVAA